MLGGRIDEGLCGRWKGVEDQQMDVSSSGDKQQSQHGGGWWVDGRRSSVRLTEVVWLCGGLYPGRGLGGGRGGGRGSADAVEGPRGVGRAVGGLGESF